MNTKILVIGANGQLGSELSLALQKKFGKDHVIASDISHNKGFDGAFEILDATDQHQIERILKKYHITQIYHLAAILSAKGEENPLHTWNINMKTWFNVLEASRKQAIDKVFYPSSIAVFGEGAPKEQTPNDAYLNPTTVYGISKLAGENWGQYYFNKYGLDVRSVRFPGIIGYQALPGGGTTDYAVDIYHSAVQNKEFNCFLKEHTALPMMFMYDAMRAAIELMDASKETVTIRTSYNISGVHFSPAEVSGEISKLYPDFIIHYHPDHRQAIADTWPNSIDDSLALKDWGWKPEYDLIDITKIMDQKLKEKYGVDKKDVNSFV